MQRMLSIVFILSMLLLTIPTCALAEDDSYAWNSYNDCINRGDYDAALAIDPVNAKAYWYRGRSEIWHSEWDAAISDMNYCINRDYALTDSYYYRGRGYAGKLSDEPNSTAYAKQAITDFSETIKRDAKYGNAWFFRAGVYAQIGDVNNARADYQQFLSLKSSDADAAHQAYARQQLAVL